MGASSFLRRLFRPVLGGMDERARLLLSLSESLLGELGEFSGAALARDALAAYRRLDERARAQFFDVLAADYSPPPDAVNRAAEAYRAQPSPENLAALERAAEPPRRELFHRLNMAPGGTAALVEMRKHVLHGLRQHPHWRVVDADLLHLLRSWFNLGFLRLERIDWHTPAIVLEKLAQYEAVHEMQGWRDLRRRLEADRRCFAFFHPRLPDDPIIFIEVALTEGMSARVQPLIDENLPVASPADADCAMFYSITNCQEGLRGISFGNLLIKQVAEELKRELPQLRTFATLSPIPGFRRWLDEARPRVGVGPDGEERLRLLARLDQADPRLQDAPEEMQRLLLVQCAHYLVHEKHGEEPLDPVARFHLGNGASLERLNWLADPSPHGISRSAGMMVNYVYRLPEVERNHERYFREHEVVASRAIEKLAREATLAAVNAGR